MELPEDVVHTEILTRLPLKSVGRFKCVSKSWLSLFSSSRFISDHFTRSTTLNPDDYDFLITMKDDGIYILSHHKETSLLHASVHDYQVIGSVHGLLCLHRQNSVDLLLWNPAIHEAKKLTLPVCRSNDLTRIGFGFDPVTNDYKVVVCGLCDGKRDIYVYSSSSASWTELFISDYMYSSGRVHKLVGPTTIVKDCPYWRYSKYSSDKRFKYVFLVRFDVGSNKFKELPEFCRGVKINGSRRKRVKFVSMKDNLTLMVYEPNSLNLMVDIYSLDEEERSWIQSKIYNIRICKTEPTEIVKPRLTQGFECGGEFVLHERGQFFWYDQKTETIKQILNKRSVRTIIRCYRYTPSLVSLKGMNSVYLQTPAHIFGH